MSNRSIPNEAWRFPNGSFFWHGSIQIDPSSNEGQTIISILNQQTLDRQKQTPTPLVNPLTQKLVYRFDIHCEDGGSKLGVQLSGSDFELLKQDVHIMAVINITSVLGFPNTVYNPDLKTWIEMHSITPVP